MQEGMVGVLGDVESDSGYRLGREGGGRAGQPDRGPSERQPAVQVFAGVSGLNRLGARVAAPDPSRFRVRREEHAVGVFRVEALEMSPFQLLAPFAPDRPSIAILRRGSVEFRIDGRAVDLLPGDAVAFERLDANAFTSRTPSAWFVLSSTVHEVWHADVGSVRRIEGPVPAAQALAHAVISSRRSGAAAPSGVRHLERALGLVLEGIFDGPDEEHGFQTALDSAALRRRALVLIGARFTEPDFRSSDIAHSLNVSVRTLQRAYESVVPGITVSDDIARFRHEYAARLLLDPELARLTIATIAERSGYSREAGLRRAFARAYGMSPREYRAEHARGRNPRIDPHSKGSRSRREPGPRVPERSGVTSGRADNTR